MTVVCALALAGLLAVASGAAAQAPAGTPVPEAIAELARAADVAVAAGQYREAADRLSEALDHPEAERLTPTVQRKLHGAVARFARWGDDLPRGLRHARLATAYPDAELGDWMQRADMARILGQHDEAADSMREAYLRWPEDVREAMDIHAAQIAWSTDFDSPARYALLKALYDGGFEWAWTGPADALWLELALQHLARGDQESARDVVARIEEPHVVVRILADRRFDAVRGEAHTPEALPELARRRVDDLRARALLDPGVVKIQAEFASALLVAGEEENAVALANDVIAALADDATERRAFVDVDTNLSWLYDRAGEALVRLGRKDEAIAMYRRAAEQREGGQPNVSQVLNLAHHLVSAGQPRAALDVVAEVGNMTPFGRMVLVNVQHRAALALGDKAAADAALDYLRRHRTDGESVYADALLDRGDADGAAADFIERLEDPSRRSEALYEAQRFLPSPTLDPERRARFRAMLAREDVQAAINRHGRILELPIHEPW